VNGYEHAASPPWVVNVTGPERLTVRTIAEQLGQLLQRPVRFQGQEAKTALLSDATLAIKQFGPPSVSADELVHQVAKWIKAGGRTLNKPTHFEVRDGRF
jgi:uncharacterized protein YbjT (DUF2867 family)